MSGRLVFLLTNVILKKGVYIYMYFIHNMVFLTGIKIATQFCSVHTFRHIISTANNSITTTTTLPQTKISSCSSVCPSVRLSVCPVCGHDFVHVCSKRWVHGFFEKLYTYLYLIFHTDWIIFLHFTRFFPVFGQFFLNKM